MGAPKAGSSLGCLAPVCRSRKPTLLRDEERTGAVVSLSPRSEGMKPILRGGPGGQSPCWPVPEALLSGWKRGVAERRCSGPRKRWQFLEMRKLGGENAAKLLLIAEFAERSDLTLAGQAADRKQVVVVGGVILQQGSGGNGDHRGSGSRERPEVGRSSVLCWPRRGQRAWLVAEGDGGSPRPGRARDQADFFHFCADRSIK